MMQNTVFAIILCLILLFVFMVMAAIVYDAYVERSKTIKVKTHVVNGYKVYEIKNVLNKQDCLDLIEFSKKKGLSNSMVWSYDGQSGNQLDESHRKSKQTWIGDAEHRVALKMAIISEFVTGIPRDHQEALQVAMYEKLGKFNDHYDACVDKDPEYCEKMNAGSGERRATLLVYLNDDFTGGETEFVNIGLKIKPERGKGILFWNTYDDETVINDSKHRGNPVMDGEKWIATKWTHQNVWKGSKTI